MARSVSSPSSAAELQVEGLEQLAVLVLGGHDLDDVVELLAEQLEGLVVDRLGRRDHLAEREEHLHQGSGVDADLLGEVGQGRAAGQADGLAVTLADADAADGRGLHGLELLATGALGLAASARRAAGATEGTLGLAALAGSPAASAAGTEAGTATGTTGSTGTGGGTATTGSTTATGGTAAATGTTRTTGTATGAAGATATGTGAEGGRGLGHHRRVGARHAGATGSTATAVTRGRGPRRTLLVAGLRGALGLRRTTAHALAGGEGVVAGTRGARTADGLRGGSLRRGGRRLGRRCRSLGLGGRLGRRGRGGLGLRRGGLGLRRGRGARLARTGRTRGRLRGRRLGGRGCRRCCRGLRGRGCCRGLRGGGLRRSGLLGGLLGRLLGGRGGGGGRLQLRAVLLLEPHLDGGLDRRRRRLDELPHLLELLENELALDTELLGEFVDSGLSHASPSGPSPGAPQFGGGGSDR